jgi:FAD/FMN-containing dehydrogenase
MPTIESAIAIARPAEAVFALLADPRNTPKWTPSVKTATVDGPVQIGARGRNVLAFLRRRLEENWLITEYEPGRRYAFQAVTPGWLRRLYNAAGAGALAWLTARMADACECGRDPVGAPHPNHFELGEEGKMTTQDVATGGPADAAVEELRAGLRGPLTRPGDEAYEAARQVWNGMIDRRPALIAHCSGVADVIAAVNFARTHELPLAVRGGGHNVAGSAVCDGGLVIDLSRLNNVRVDPHRRTVRAGGGARLGDVDHETQAFGLAVPFGVVSRTGIAGLTLHGGLGFLTRKYGLSCDNLIAADVVTAEGRLFQVDAQNHADLLWALRGGGGNFGVVTSLEYRLHPVGPEVWMGMVFYPVEQAPAALRFFRDFMAGAPEELMAIAIFWTAPEIPEVPAEWHGKPALVFGACYSGPLEMGEEALRPLREFATPIVDLSGPMPFVVGQQLFDPDYPDGGRYYWKSIYLRDLDQPTIEALMRHAADRPSAHSSIDVWALGGALVREPVDGSAFAGRENPFLLGIEANWHDPADDEANVAWARALFREMGTLSGSGVYLNFPGFGEEKEDLVRAAYGPNYERLAAIKAKYDPTNLFRLNQNIPPRT